MGVTGTKGKTTVVELLHEILKEGGAKVASLSSLRFRIGDKIQINDRKMTMPGRFFVQKFLHEAAEAGCKYAILEVTSEGIKQFRHRFIRFQTAVMTNVSSEHIESHGSFEKYLRAKLDLFWRLPKRGLAIINRDDPLYQRFSAATPAHKIFYGKEGVAISTKLLAVRHVKINEGGIDFEINNQVIFSPLLGEFNFYNVLAAVTAGLSQHVAYEKIAAAVSGVSVIPGRVEFVQKEPFDVVVDYAHTPDSLKKVYTFLKESNPALICVLGAAGGGRDKWKRPELGRIAAEFCDEIILTNEDSYDEDPASIVEEVSRGVGGKKCKKILDRRMAIREALKLARGGDAVVITGKGAEPLMAGPLGAKIPWDDREVIREELAKILKYDKRRI